MKILSAEQIRQWDQYTIEQEPILSINLMERAAGKCTAWLMQQYPDAPSFAIFCGKGNNGGDGLPMARMLMENNYAVSIYILEFGHKGTDDFQTNLARLHSLPNPDIHFIQTKENFHPFSPEQIVVDALLGSGINRSLEGITAQLVNHINSSDCEIVSIDIPSGLFTDHSSNGQLTIQATHTLSFQCHKPAFFMSENEAAIGEVHLLDIGLNDDYYKSIEPLFELTDEEIIQSIYKPRKSFSHKGTYGHALIVAGSYGKMGAAVLSSKACMRSGVGLLTCHIPSAGYNILQSTVPEAMVMTDINSSIITKIDVNLSMYKSIGIGPGIGTAAETTTMLQQLLTNYKKPMVIDADALNILAAQKDLLKLLPAQSILTPHPKEFERLFGEKSNEFDRISLAQQKAKELNCIIVLKGHHTFIAAPDGKSIFNSTGNPGMATAGSGDVLTGILTGLLAQGYPSKHAAILGVYLHGLAGDIAASSSSQEGLIASDIIYNLPKAFASTNNK